MDRLRNERLRDVVVARVPGLLSTRFNTRSDRRPLVLERYVLTADL